MFYREKIKQRKPNFNIGDTVVANYHSEMFRGKKFVVKDMHQDISSGYYYTQLQYLDKPDKTTIPLYAYKLDLFSLAVESNNEDAWNRLRIQDGDLGW